jgi:hypothetical protein
MGVLSLLIPGTLLFATAILFSVWARLSVRYASGRTGVGPGLYGCAAAAVLGYLGVALAIRTGGGHKDGAELALSVFGALLLVAAWTDHRTAWAPDGITIPLLCGGAASANLLGTTGMGPLTTIGVAFGLFLISQAAWYLQAVIGWRKLPPADLMALSLPLLMFGQTIHAPLTYLTLSALLLFLLRAPEPVYRALRGPSAAEAALDARLTGSGRSAPLLPLALGALYGVLLLRLLQG